MVNRLEFVYNFFLTLMRFISQIKEPYNHRRLFHLSEITVYVSGYKRHGCMMQISLRFKLIT